MYLGHMFLRQSQNIFKSADIDCYRLRILDRSYDMIVVHLLFQELSLATILR